MIPPYARWNKMIWFLALARMRSITSMQLTWGSCATWCLMTLIKINALYYRDKMENVVILNISNMVRYGLNCNCKIKMMKIQDQDQILFLLFVCFVLLVCFNFLQNSKTTHKHKIVSSYYCLKINFLKPNEYQQLNDDLLVYWTEIWKIIKHYFGHAGCSKYLIEHFKLQGHWPKS